MGGWTNRAGDGCHWAEKRLEHRNSPSWTWNLVAKSPGDSSDNTHSLSQIHRRFKPPCPAPLHTLHASPTDRTDRPASIVNGAFEGLVCEPHRMTHRCAMHCRLVDEFCAGSTPARRWTAAHRTWHATRSQDSRAMRRGQPPNVMAGESQMHSLQADCSHSIALLT